MKYALNLSEENRVLSFYVVSAKVNCDGMPITNSIPDDFYNYLYTNNEFIYNPIPVVEPIETPSQLDIIEAQVIYTAMMTETLLLE